MFLVVGHRNVTSWGNFNFKKISKRFQFISIFIEKMKIANILGVANHRAKLTENYGSDGTSRKYYRDPLTL